jgi:hypothetical protein
LLCSCGVGSSPAADAASKPLRAAAPFGGAAPAAAVELNGSMAWFEFGADGPRAVADVLSSSLVSFEPWPLARRSTGMAVADGRIYIAVNRHGFLAVSPPPIDGASVAVHALFDAARFGPYSLSAPFSYRGLPSATLYRDRFFQEAAPAAPDPRAFSVVLDAPVPVPIEPAAFAFFPLAESWDIDACERGVDGSLVLRAARTDQVAYAAADNLNSAAAPIDAAAFRSALLPRLSGTAESPLRGALIAAAAACQDRVGIASAITDDGHGAVSFFLSPRADADPETALAAANRPPVRAWAYSDRSRAFVLFPDGLCAASGAVTDAVSGAADRLTRFPALPEGFAYTGIAAAGSVVVVTWEEQKEWSVGAAGFAVVDAAAVTGRPADDVLY